MSKISRKVCPTYEIASDLEHLGILPKYFRNMN
jgi:hypothetical protein